MTKKALWQHIKELIDCDKNIAALENDITTSKQSVAGNTQHMDKLRNNLADQKQRILNAKKTLDLEKLDIKDYQAQEEKKEEKLQKISDPKAYKALEKELEMVNFKRVQLEEKVLKDEDTLAKSEAVLSEEEMAAEEECSKLTHENKLKQDNILDLEKKLEALKTQRHEITPTVPAEWLSKYERMKQTVKDPIVPVSNGHCGACFYTILHQDLMKLKKSNVLLCRNCYRFLYYDQEEQKAETQASY